MKTMLGPRYDDQVEEANRFHPSMLFNHLKSLKVGHSAPLAVELLNLLKAPFIVLFIHQVKMGLLVDLTNTNRFYDRNDIEKEGIKYVKLACKG